MADGNQSVIFDRAVLISWFFMFYALILIWSSELKLKPLKKSFTFLVGFSREKRKYIFRSHSICKISRKL